MERITKLWIQLVSKFYFSIAVCISILYLYNWSKCYSKLDFLSYYRIMIYIAVISMMIIDMAINYIYERKVKKKKFIKSKSVGNIYKYVQIVIIVAIHISYWIVPIKGNMESDFFFMSICTVLIMITVLKLYIHKTVYWNDEYMIYDGNIYYFNRIQSFERGLGYNIIIEVDYKERILRPGSKKINNIIFGVLEKYMKNTMIENDCDF